MKILNLFETANKICEEAKEDRHLINGDVIWTDLQCLDAYRKEIEHGEARPAIRIFGASEAEGPLKEYITKRLESYGFHGVIVSLSR